ncbi:hypothetical protein ACI3L3_11175 [Desulfobaculum sp. SPO524]|uniref:hypothetical protein n=1 Tax=Desulfobaculum sp. SPO524 TaxID=3378071 RepID=UPI003852F35E
MGFISRFFNPTSREAKLVKLQNELCQDYKYYQDGGSAAGALLDQLNEMELNPNSQQTKALRYEAAKLEYLDLCMQDGFISDIMNRSGATQEDLWSMAESLAEGGLACRRGGKWVHLDVISNKAPFMYYVAHIGDVSMKEIVFTLLKYYNGEINDSELIQMSMVTE